MARKGLLIFLTILGLFLVGTVVVLSSISYWLAIDQLAYVTEREVPSTAGRDNSTSSLANERIPRILHQTWKTDTLPERWQPVSQQCRDLMPD
jgi:mannosyltransferase OCH1-like enzyme